MCVCSATGERLPLGPHPSVSSSEMLPFLPQWACEMNQPSLSCMCVAVKDGPTMGAEELVNREVWCMCVCVCVCVCACV